MPLPVDIASASALWVLNTFVFFIMIFLATGIWSLVYEMRKLVLVARQWPSSFGLVSRSHPSISLPEVSSNEMQEVPLRDHPPPQQIVM